MKKILLASVLALPIVALLGLTFYKKSIYDHGREFTLAIEGYDPRDLISGRYLVFRYKFPIGNVCGDDHSGAMYVCLETMVPTHEHNPSCQSTMAGRCQYGLFTTGNERFYIPEDKAQDLEKKVIEGRAAVQLMVKGDSLVIKDLLIDGKPWNQLDP